MKHRIDLILGVLLISLLGGGSPAEAACTNPAGGAGDLVYNSSGKVFQYCNDLNWKAISMPGTGSGGCANPALAEGELAYNVDARTIQGCTGNVQRAAGQIGGGMDWIVVDGGGGYACGIKSDRSLWCWGYNGYGQLGDNSTTTRLFPVQISGGGVWKAVSAGSNHTCAIKSDDTAWCWGRGSEGQMGSGTSPATQLTPIAVTGGSTWKLVSAGDDVTCGIKSDDTAHCWGWAYEGRLGNGTTTPNINTPGPVSGGGAWKTISAGSHICGIMSDDTMRCWGYSGNGQVGDGTTISRSSPVTITGGGTWKSVTVGTYHTCAIKSDDSMYCWGYDGSGQLGGSGLPSTPVTGGGSWKAVSAGFQHNCAIKADDTLWCWGSNWYGQLANGTTNGSSSPVSVAGSATWQSSTGVNNSTCGIRNNGALWCWGAASNGVLGNNKTAVSAFPVRVYGGDNWKSLSARGGGHACGIKSDDTAWCWGNAGTSAGGDYNNLNVPTAFPIAGTWNAIRTGGESANGEVVNTCGIKTDGTAWCWGYGGSGQLGHGASPAYTLAGVAVSGGGTWKSIGVGVSFACGIKSDDTAWCWGAAANGRLGNGTTTPNVNTPQTLSGGGTWKSVVPGDAHVCGIKSDDTAWCWGTAANGRLGNGATTPDQSSPATISGGGTWKVISAGGAHSCGIKIDDTAWCWGAAAGGRLGNGTTTPDQSAPATLSGGGAWKLISAGYEHSCGIKSDDTLWCWGTNNYGQVGDGTTTNRTASVQVSGGGAWKSVMAGRHFSCGLTMGDELMCWGYGADGQLGDGETGFVTSLRQIWCTAPSGKPGDIVYNADANVMQYCDGAGWVKMGR